MQLTSAQHAVIKQAADLLAEIGEERRGTRDGYLAGGTAVSLRRLLEPASAPQVPASR